MCCSLLKEQRHEDVWENRENTPSILNSKRNCMVSFTLEMPDSKGMSPPEIGCLTLVWVGPLVAREKFSMNS